MKLIRDKKAVRSQLEAWSTDGLEFAGGVGTMLAEARGQIGQVLSPDQVTTMTETGFEFGEYLGLEAPWEKLQPPPPSRR